MNDYVLLGLNRKEIKIIDLKNKKILEVENR